MPNHHPNNAIIPAKPKISKLKTLWSFWPLVAWLGVIWFCYYAHRQGVRFRRMNAAVDVYQENVSPMRDGFLDRLHTGVKRGAFVKKNDPVAYLKSDDLNQEKALLETEIAREREDKILDLTRDMQDLDMDLQKLKTDESAAAAVAVEGELSAKAFEEAQRNTALKTASAMGLSQEKAKSYLDSLPPDPEASKARMDARKDAAKSRSLLESIKRLEAIMDGLAKQKNELSTIDLSKPENLLKVATSGQLSQLKVLEEKMAKLVLKANCDGYVDLINKENGEFVKQGEGILKIVAKPSQIVAFLPQDQLGAISVGDKVWLTATNDRKTIIEGCSIQYLAPRMNTVADSTSPIPNKRLFGRDVIIDYPSESGLLPGQTVIVHLEDPRDVPFLSSFINGLFSNDDLDGTEAAGKKK